MIPGKTFRSLLILLSLIFLSTFSSWSTQTVFKGKAISYAGENLHFLTYADMISFREIDVATGSVSDSGEFNCTANIDEIRLIFVRLGIYNCIFYAEPGLIYQLQLPQKIEKTEAEELNPYYEETTIHLIARPVGTADGRAIPGDQQEINVLIRSFNDAFNPFYYKYVVNAYMNAVDQDEIKKALQTITEPFADVHHPFFLTYMDYRLGLLKHYGAQQSVPRILADFFTSRNVNYHNPAFMELFNEIFSGYFDLFATENPQSNLPYIINREINLDKLISHLRKEKSFLNDTLLQMVIAKNLYDCFYKENYSKSAILILIDSLNSKTTIPFIKSVISNVKLEITRLMTGSAPPSFQLYDKDSVLLGLDDFRGKYVYLVFCNSYSYYCIREFELLNDLNSRHSSHLEIVTVLVDENYQSMKDLLKANKFNWTFLHYSFQPEIIKEYEVKAYPAYYLIGPDGKLIASPAPAPLEGFEQYLFKTMKARGEI